MACRNIGTYYKFGRGVRKNEKRAAAAFRKACEAEHDDAGNDLGAAYAEGKGVPKDWQQAVSLYRRACDLGNEAGCNDLRAEGGSFSGVLVDIETGDQKSGTHVVSLPSFLGGQSIPFDGSVTKRVVTVRVDARAIDWNKLILEAERQIQLIDRSVAASGVGDDPAVRSAQAQAKRVLRDQIQKWRREKENVRRAAAAKPGAEKGHLATAAAGRFGAGSQRALPLRRPGLLLPVAGVVPEQHARMPLPRSRVRLPIEGVCDRVRGRVWRHSRLREAILLQSVPMPGRGGQNAEVNRGPAFEGHGRLQHEFQGERVHLRLVGLDASFRGAAPRGVGRRLRCRVVQEGYRAIAREPEARRNPADAFVQKPKSAEKDGRWAEAARTFPFSRACYPSFRRQTAVSPS